MADNILWNQIKKRLQVTLGDAAFIAWENDYSPEIISTEDNTLAIHVTRQGEHISPIGKQISEILREMGLENTAVKFVSAGDTMTIDSKDIQDIYDEVVNPDRALYLPGYFERWVSQVLGADYGMTVASYAQARWESGGRTQGGMFTARIPADKIAARAGCSTRTLRRRLASEDFQQKTKGLLEFLKNTDWDNSSGTPHKLPSKVRVFTTMPLTPSDTAHLRKWITENIEFYDGPEGVLRAAEKTPVTELIGNPDEDCVEDALTVLELVSSMFDGQIKDKLLAVLASNLYQHIMPSEDRIKITIFFMEQILPLIGAAQGWLLTWLRDRCYEDEKMHRNIVKIEQGWQELAAACGMSRAKTIYEWLNAKHPEGHPQEGKYVNSILRLYIAEVLKDEPQLSFEQQLRTFRVLTKEIPMEILEAVITGEGIVAELTRSDICTLGLADLSTHPVWQKADGGNVTIGMADLSPSNGAIVTNGLADLSTSVGGYVTVKALKLFKPALNTNQLTPAEPAATEALPASEPKTETEPAPQEPESVGRSVSDWTFSKLAQISNVNPTRIKYMTDTVPNEQERAARFVGWILHAHSPKAKNLKDETGVGVAIVSIGNRPDNEFMRLAKLGEQNLRALFDSDFSRTLGEDTREEMIYRKNFKKLVLHRKQDLYYRLFGVEAPEPAPVAAATAISGGAEVTENNNPEINTHAPIKVVRRQINVTAHR